MRRSATPIEGTPKTIRSRRQLAGRHLLTQTPNPGCRVPPTTHDASDNRPRSGLRLGIWVASFAVLTVAATIVPLFLTTSQPNSPFTLSRFPPGRFHHNYRPENLLSPFRHFGDQRSFGWLAHPLVVSKWLVVLDRKPMNTKNHQLLVIDRTSGNIVHTSGPVGQGPSDIGRPASLERIATSDHHFILSDSRNARFMVYNLHNWTGQPEQIIRHVDAALLFRILWLKDDTLAGNGTNLINELLRFYNFDERRNSLERAGTAGKPWFTGQPPLVAARLSHNVITSNPTGDKIGLASTWINRIEIYDAAGNLLRVTGGPEEVIPRFTIEGGTKVRPDYAAGYSPSYVDIDATDDYIFALFMGGPEPQRNLAREIHVFDWDGHFLDVYGLEEGIGFLAIDAAATSVYGVRLDPYPSIVEYRLPSLGRSG